ncbi:hypothetical protein SCLCIDRAFT_58984, partial [Scleroderma citrinum Foug A]
DKKQHETLFGPNIGVVNSTPSWTQPISKQTALDKLSPEIIQTWMAKSKEPSQPTTTLQALVNLKRPTLRLVPLTAVPDDPSQTDSHHHHGLEFEYDCDAPKCRINVNVILPGDHPLAGDVDESGFFRIPIFESIVNGGFGKVLKLEEGAALELDRFEHTGPGDVLAHPASPATPKNPGTTEGTESGLSDNSRTDPPRKRFSAFQFRKHPMTRSVSGPALTVVDADRTHVSERGAKEDTREGVRVSIRLSALDENGIDASTNNEQVTYLHIIRLGAPAEREEDTRPWVVKVVKRDAIIGPYVFQLYEIYGLSSSAPAPTQPRTSPTSTDGHTYPPNSGLVPPIREEELSSECLVCLSSPREVILLPCRHLVACKACAINMVEFGAGGTITQTDDTANSSPSAAGEGTTSTAPGTAGQAVTAPSVVPPNPRRKRRAKGWNCPVCRQPYTSLLRISTAPPTKDITDDDHRTSVDHEDGEGSDLELEHELEQEPEPEHELSQSDHSTAHGAPPTGNGVLNTLRSSLRRNMLNGDNGTLPPDVERGAGLAAA